MVSSASCAAGQTPLQSYFSSQHRPTCQVAGRCEQMFAAASSDAFPLTGFIATASHNAFAPGETCPPLFLLVCGAVDEVAEVLFGVNTAEQLCRGYFREPNLLWRRKSTLREVFISNSPSYTRYQSKLRIQLLMQIVILCF